MSAAYVRKMYGVPAKRGMRIICDGNPGVITSFDGQYVRVRFDGMKYPVRCHPTWEMTYLTEPAS